jgi:hypothetical protein
VDARLHHVQREAEQLNLLALLQDFYREKLAMLFRHQAAARQVGQYDVNNTYQYIINRDETQLSWVAAAISDLGAAVAEPGASVQGRGDRGDGAHRSTGGRGRDDVRAAIESDGRDAQSFVDRWRPRVDAMTNARHAKMLLVILGEVLEQKRFFEQALAGRTDLLGRRGQEAGPAQGEVLATRWIE